MKTVLIIGAVVAVVAVAFLLFAGAVAIAITNEIMKEFMDD